MNSIDFAELFSTKYNRSNQKGIIRQLSAPQYLINRGLNDSQGSKVISKKVYNKFLDVGNNCDNKV